MTVSVRVRAQETERPLAEVPAASQPPPLSPAELGVAVPEDSAEVAAPRPVSRPVAANTVSVLASATQVSLAGEGPAQPARFTLALDARRRVASGPVDVEVGLRGSALWLPYTSSTASGTSHVWTALVVGRLSRRLAEGAELGAHAGGGLSSWTGLSPGNPFTHKGAPSTGPVPMPTFAVGLDLTTRLASTRLVLVFMPTYVVSWTTSAGLVAQISRVRRLEATLGLGVRF